MMAAASNLVEAVAQLIDAGADINMKDVDGNTPAHFAYAFGSAGCASLLESRSSHNITNHAGESPVFMAGKFRKMLPLY